MSLARPIAEIMPFVTVPCSTATESMIIMNQKHHLWSEEGGRIRVALMWGALMTTQKTRCFRSTISLLGGHLGRAVQDVGLWVRFPSLTSLLVFSALPMRKSTLTGNEHSRSYGVRAPGRGRTPRGDVPAGKSAKKIFLLHLGKTMGSVK